MTKASSTRDDVMAGAFAGASARLITAPFDVLKIRFQLQFAQKVKYTSLRQAFSTVIKEEGVIGLWKGNVAATYLWISYAMVQFGVYGFLKKSLEAIPDPFINRIDPPRNVDIFAQNKSITQKETNNVLLPEQTNAHSTGSKIWRAFILFLAGAGAGITATASTYPFDIMRTQFAIQGKDKPFTSMQSFISHTFKTKGITGFYAGLSPALVGITPYMGLNFALYESVKSFSESSFFQLNSKYQNSITDINGKSEIPKVEGTLASVLRKGLCGAVAGGTSKFIVYPLDTLKKRMQVQVLQNTLTGVGSVPQYDNVWHCIVKTYADEGVKGFYKGIIPTTAKAVVATAVTFAAYEGAIDFFEWQRKLKAEKNAPVK